MYLPVFLTTIDDCHCITTRALLDSGCTGSSIDAGFVWAKGFNTHKLACPVPVYNADGTLNHGGSIAEYLTLQVAVGHHLERVTFGITTLGSANIFLGLEWLKCHNPSIDWQQGTVQFDRCPHECGYVTPLQEPEDTGELIGCVHPDVDESESTVHLEEGERIFAFNYKEYIKAGVQSIQAVTTTSQQLAEEAFKTKVRKSFKELVPQHYHDFVDIFKKELFDELPPRKPWDHAIELILGEHTIDCKVYNLSPEEQ